MCTRMRCSRRRLWRGSVDDARGEERDVEMGVAEMVGGEGGQVGSHVDMWRRQLVCLQRIPRHPPEERMDADALGPFAAGAQSFILVDLWKDRG